MSSCKVAVFLINKEQRCQVAVQKLPSMSSGGPKAPKHVLYRELGVMPKAPKHVYRELGVMDLGRLD